MTLIGRLLNPSARPRAVRKQESPESPYQAIAELAGSLRYHQTMPLRFQREWLAMFLVGVMLLGLVAGLYLNVTSRAAIAGREIQGMEVNIAANQRINADLETQIAVLLSNTVLADRAKALGYEPVTRDSIEYMVVPGYFPQQGLSLVQPVAATDLMAVSPEYTESLFDWLGRQLESASKPLK
jgi:hypothetical protein